MFTTCSHCHTRFKVTAKQLKVADGQVRCGKCDQVFDAYVALESSRAKPAPVPTVPEVTAELSVMVGSKTTPDLNVSLAAESEPPAGSMDLQQDLLKPEVPPLEDLFAELPDENDLKPLPPPMAPEPEPEPVTGKRRKPRTPLRDVGAGLSAEQEAEQKAPRTVPLNIDFAHAHDLPAHPAPKPRRPAASAAWWGGVALLALLLLVQLMNVDREALAQNGVLGPSLEAVYAALGDPLPPAESVQEWEVSELNVTTDPDLPGALSITGSLANHAAYTQSWPTLRVMLTDRFGSTLRARDFKPAEYLPGTQANVRLAAGQASRFRLDILDPGADAVGFSLSPCLDAAGGRVCAASEHD